MKWWVDARFGMFIHWGPVSLKGTEIGWSRGREVPIAVYDHLYKEFNPVEFDARQYNPTKMPKNWSRRYKHNRDKLKTGDIFEVAEVVRNLAIRHCDKGLSTGEKQMFSKAKKILASELMYARDMSEDAANAFLDAVLDEVGAAGPAAHIDAHDLAHEVAPVA